MSQVWAFYWISMSSSSDTMCERCDGLCCKVYDIVDNDTGNHVKKAWDTCVNLDASNKCRIYNDRHNQPGYRDSCMIYDCMEGWPIVTIFARRLGEHEYRTGIISSLLETIRIRIEESPEHRARILQFSEDLLNNLTIDVSIHIAIKMVRIKIMRWQI